MMLTGAGAGAWADASLEPVCFADVPHCVTPGLMSHCVNAGIGAVLAVALCWRWRCAGGGAVLALGSLDALQATVPNCP